MLNDEECFEANNLDFSGTFWGDYAAWPPYASPSFYNQQPGIMSAVLIYKINSDYQIIN